MKTLGWILVSFCKQMGQGAWDAKFMWVFSSVWSTCLPQGSEEVKEEGPEGPWPVHEDEAPRMGLVLILGC